MDLSWIVEFWAAHVPVWAVALLGIASTAFLALLVHALAFRIANRVLENGRASAAAAFVRRIRWPARLILLAFFFTTVLPALPIDDDVSLLLRRIASLSLIAMFGWMAISIVNLGGDILAQRYDIAIADNLVARRAQTQLGILRRALVIVIVVVTVSIMLMTTPEVREIGVSLFASAGVAGLAIGLAARPMLSNLIAGLQIALTQPIRIDDVVVVENEWGRIEEITASYVVVRIWDERRLIVPLSHFIETPFQNWTAKSAQIIGTVFWHLDYTAPIDEMRKKLDEFLRESKHWDGRVALVQVTNADKATIEVRALLSAANSGAAWDLRCEVREKMIDYLKEHHPACLPRMRQELHGGPTPVQVGAGRDRSRKGGQSGGAPGLGVGSVR